MINKDNIFVLSGILSITFYIFIIFFFFIYSHNHKVKKISINTKETFLELEVVSKKISNKAKISKEINFHDKTITKKTNLKIKSKSISTKRVTNLKSLFAKVKTKAIKINKDKALNIKKSNQISRYKSKFEKQRKQEISKLIKSINKINVKTNLNNEKIQFDTDKYYSKIKEILTLRWYTWNTTILNNLTAKVIIFIDTQGHFSYRIIKNFGYDQVDLNLESFLDSETNRLYPKPKKDASIEIIFKLEKE